jgi:hypothetical protein
MLACARYGARRCLPIVAVLNAEDGITTGELASLLDQSTYSSKFVMRSAVKLNWIRDTGEKKGRSNVYRRTAGGQQVVERIQLCR